MDQLAAALLRARSNNSKSVVVMGASNLAARRAAKANRRKAVVARKRKAEMAGGSVAGQVARAAALPIRCCLYTERLFETGVGTVLLARGNKVGPLAVAGFLLDTFCLGVKDVLFREMADYQLEHYRDMLGQATPLVPVDPCYARKLLRDLTRWSGSLGFQPPREFVTVERLFGNTDPQACDATFEFGMSGKPLYVPGPSETMAVSRQHIEQLRDQLGVGGFDFVFPV